MPWRAVSHVLAIVPCNLMLQREERSSCWLLSPHCSRSRPCSILRVMHPTPISGGAGLGFHLQRVEGSAKSAVWAGHPPRVCCACTWCVGQSAGADGDSLAGLTALMGPRAGSFCWMISSFASKSSNCLMAWRWRLAVASEALSLA